MSDLILVVDDEEDMRDIVRTLLEINGFNVLEASSAEEMFDKIDTNDISLIILDIGLPESDGLTAMKETRLNNDIPIVLLTGKGDVIDKVLGLELGADDYITKPFHSHELIARIKSVLRRANPPVDVKKNELERAPVVRFAGWELNISSQRLVNPEGQEKTITSHEFSILQALIEAAGRTLSREQLLDSVSSGRREYLPFDRSLDVMVAKIRKKLGDDPKNPRFIKTIRQTGYMFIALLG